jgi:hypothetical protein
MTHNPHDALFKRAFSERENAAGELRAVLPEAIASALDFGTLRVCAGSYVDEALRDLHSDLLYSIHLGGREAFVYVLFEHQSGVDRWMPYRLLRYIGRVWEDWRRDHPRAQRLPAVIPVVLHHGKAGWTGPKGLHELIDLEPELLEAVGVHLPQFRLVIDDLGAQSDEALYRRAMSAYGRLVLWSLRSASDGRRLRPESLHLWARALRELGQAPNGREALETVFRYLVQVLGEGGREVIDVLAESADEAVKEAYVTLYDEILEEGRKRGREEGLHLGREEGRRALVLKLLTSKFGPPSEATRRRVDLATDAELEAWAERVLVAIELEEVWR